MKALVMIVTCAALFIGSGLGRAVEPAHFSLDQGTTRDLEPGYGASRGDSLGLKSPKKASRLSLIGTLVPFSGGLRLSNTGGSGAEIAVAVAAAGVLIGPSLGYFYGGCGRRGLTGIAVRGGLAVVGAIAATAAEWPSLWGSDDEGNSAAGFVVLVFCGVLVDMVIDLARVSGTVSRENDRRLHERPTISPTVRALSGSTEPAFGLTVRF